MRLVAILFAVAGCGDRSGPPSTDTSSASMPALAERVDYLERYVAFRRTYRDLAFRIRYRNNGGGAVPGPSEWDIRLVAVVPPVELASWIPEDQKGAKAPAPDWLADVPETRKAIGDMVWYTRPGLEVGIDRVRSIVAYRSWAR